MSISHTRRDLVALALSLLTLGSVAVGIAACGDDDLFFPGELPPTPTEEPTSTPDEDEDEDI